MAQTDGMSRVFPYETQRYSSWRASTIICTMNWMLIFTFPLLKWHLCDDLHLYFLKLRQTGSVSRAKMSSFTCTFSHATNRWRREGDGENEKEPHKRMQQATVTRFPPQRRELASWLTEAKISVLNQRKNVVRWYLSAREAWNKVLLWTFQAFQSCICIGSANKIGYNAMLYERDAL